MHNRNYGTRNSRSSASKDYKAIAAKNKIAQGKRVQQIDDAGEIVNEFMSLHEAEEKTGYKRSFVSACCHGKYEKAYGYRWRFETTTQ